MSKKKPGASEQAAISLGQQEQDLARQQQGLAQRNETQRNTLSQEAEGDLHDLDYFSGDPQASPYYKAMVTSGMEGAASSYGNAQVAARRRALAQGYAGSPVELGAQAEIGNEQARAEAGVPRQALMDAIEPKIQAAQIKSGARFGFANQFNPEQALLGSGSALSSSGQALDLQSQLEAARNKRRTGLFGTLAKIGAVGASFIPGVGPAISKGIDRFGSLGG